jgi:hypothetical protein
MAMMKAEKARKKAVKMAYCSKRPGECLKVSGYFIFTLKLMACKVLNISYKHCS